MANKSSFSLSSLIKDCRDKWYWFAISVVIFLILGLLYVRISKTIYQVQANLLISQDDGTPGLSNLTDLFGSSGDVDDEIFVVASHTVYHDVVRDLQLNKTHSVKTGFLKRQVLFQDFPVDVLMNEDMADTLKTSLLFKLKIDEKGIADLVVKDSEKKILELSGKKLPLNIKTPYGNFQIVKTPQYVEGEPLNTTISVAGYHAAAEVLSHQVLADFASKKSNVINLSLNTFDPEYGKKIINDIITKYNDYGIRQKNLQSEQTLEFVDSRIRLLAGDLNDAESSIQTYKEKEGIVDVQAETSYQMSKKSSYDNQAVAAETSLELIKMTRDYICDPANEYNLIPVMGAIGEAQSLINAYNGLVMQRMNLEKTASANNIALKQLTEQLAAQRKNINITLDKMYETAKIKLNDLRAEANLAQAKLSNVPTQEREFLNMKRQQEVKQQLYLFLLQQREQTAMIMSNTVAKGVIIDEAFTLNKPVSLGSKVILFIAFLLGLAVPAGLIYLIKLLRSKFSTREEVERITNVPILGEVCTVNSSSPLVITATTTSSCAELFRLIRTNLQFVLNGNTDKVLLMTSTVAGEGKSFISINLAASLALLKKKVLLIGMDIRNPQLDNYLSLNASRGLTNYISSDSISIDDIILTNPLGNNVDIITAGPIPPNPGELLLSEKVDNLFNEMRARYDYIVVDSAPVGMVSDTFSLTRISDATVYVCRANYTDVKDLKYLNDIHAEGRLKKLALVINGVATKRGYGYGYGRTSSSK